LRSVIHCRLTANIPAILTFVSFCGFQQANNIRLQSKRAYSAALVGGLGGAGALIASVSFRPRDFPHYTLGLWITVGAQIAGFLVVVLLMAWLAWRNRVAAGSSGNTSSEAPKAIEGMEGFVYTI